MSLSELPEERVQDILSYLLCVPHAVFNKPGRWRSQPAHQVLEVCRLWLRVGTPLLYECLVLTKTKHTASVAELFRAHPHVGTAVRCLKLQGAFGQELREVVQFIPQRLESLYIYMYMHDPRDVYDGYFMALPALKPETLYLQGRLGHAPVGMTEKIDKTISNLIRDGTWSLVSTPHSTAPSISLLTFRTAYIRLRSERRILFHRHARRGALGLLDATAHGDRPLLSARPRVPVQGRRSSDEPESARNYMLSGQAIRRAQLGAH